MKYKVHAYEGTLAILKALILPKHTGQPLTADLQQADREDTSALDITLQTLAGIRRSTVSVMEVFQEAKCFTLMSGADLWAYIQAVPIRADLLADILSAIKGELEKFFSRLA